MQTKTAPKSDLDDLLGLNRDYIRSVQTSDVHRFGEILADDFLCTNPDGSLVDRAGFLKQTALPVKISNLEAHDVNVRVIGGLRDHSRKNVLYPPGRRARSRSLHGRVGTPARPLARGVGPRHALLTGRYLVSTRDVPRPTR